MSLAPIRKKGTTRRGFVKNVAAGAGGIAFAALLRSELAPGKYAETRAPAELLWL
jgi:hypothetical protein